jgi:hypothetical protein
MQTQTEQRELLIMDGAAPAKDLESIAIDIYGDGNAEIVIAGSEALLWYRPATFER